MANRFTLLFLILVVGLLAAWFLRTEGRARDSAPQETARSEAEDASLPAALESASETVHPEDQRESIQSSGPAGARKETKEGVSKPTDKGSATLIVRAIDKANGRTLPRVRVTILPQALGSYTSMHIDGANGTLQTSPLTDEEGRAEFELPSRMELRVSARGEDDGVGRMEVEVDPLEPTERRELTLEIPTGDDLHFFMRVLAREGRLPVADASVELLRGQTRFTSRGGEQEKRESIVTTLAEGVTDSDGRFDVWLPSWKEPDVRVRARGFGEVLLRSGKEHDSPEDARVVLLSRAATLQALIIDASGAPPGDRAMRLWTEAYGLATSDNGEFFSPSISEPEWIKEIAPSGQCVLEGLPPDVPLHVEILCAGEVVKKDLPSLSLQPGEVREVEWRLGAGCRLEGSVVDQEGEPVRGQKIWLQRADVEAPKVFQVFHSGEVVVESRTDSEGRFVFADVSPGRWWVGPAAERMDWDAADPKAVAPMAEVVEVPEGASLHEIDLRVDRGLYIRGRVLDPADAPSPETYVMGHTEAGVWGFSAQTEDNGTFAMGPLASGRYWLNAHGNTHADSEPIEASAGDVDVILRLQPGGALKGMILDGLTGAPCAGQVTVTSSGSLEGNWRMSSSRDDGKFRFDGLAPGTYCLAARASDRRVGLLRDLPVRTGSEPTDCVVTLQPGAELRLKYAGKEGFLYYRIVSEGVTVAGDGVPAGGSSTTAVPAGHLWVECQWTDANSEEEPTIEAREIDVQVGEDTELVFGGGT